MNMIRPTYAEVLASKPKTRELVRGDETSEYLEFLAPVTDRLQRLLNLANPDTASLGTYWITNRWGSFQKSFGEPWRRQRRVKNLAFPWPTHRVYCVFGGKLRYETVMAILRTPAGIKTPEWRKAINAVERAEQDPKYDSRPRSERSRLQVEMLEEADWDKHAACPHYDWIDGKAVLRPKPTNS